ncbi:MAG: PIN domain-containing protein [Promicromonosporaceae bacterium]|nr:PIN domain-containing protein [Promicromonosporaceae bacterium]
MGRRLILDTNILIAIERGVSEVVALFADDDELAIAAVSRAELLAGPAMTGDPALRARRQATALAVLSAVTVLDYSTSTSDRHAELLAHTRKSGLPRGPHDLIIAAHAAETGRRVLTRDVKARFGGLPGVSLAG